MQQAKTHLASILSADPQDEVPRRVRKRDGSVVIFDPKKIDSAICRAGAASGEFTAEVAQKLTELVVGKLREAPVQDIEHIQDVVELTLLEARFIRTARSYIVYREQHARLRADQKSQVDVAGSIDEYLSRADWRVNANANQGYSLGGLILNSAGKMIANYWLSHVYPPEIGMAHRNGDFHIHDLDFLAGYCAGWSLRTLLEEGLNGVPGKIEASPPRHMSSAIGQIVNFLGTLQNEWAGAQALSSFDTYIAPFIRKDAMTYKQVKQNIQELIYNLNVPSRWGNQCVDEETECLTENGWKHYSQITKGEKILTFNCDKNTYEYLVPQRIASYDFNGDMYVLKNRTQEQWITPGHRVVRKVFNTDNHWELLPIEEVIKFKSPIIIPNSWETTSIQEIDDQFVQLLAWTVAEGNFDASENRTRVSIFQSQRNQEHVEEIRTVLDSLGFSYHIKTAKSGGFSPIPVHRIRINKRGSEAVTAYTKSKIVPPVVRTLSARQIRLFLDTYAKGDGTVEQNGRMRLYTKDKANLDALQELCSLVGWGSTVIQRKTNGVYVLNIIRNKETYIQEIERKRYIGKVWCPTTVNGTFVARRKGKTFITGNTPFTNLTFDWVCPEDLRSQHPIIGGEIQPFCYGDLQVEMDLINRTYIEVMSEGDIKGRIFTFPIPTYNITADFPWESENASLLFEMTAKYGLAYFQNFINSDLKPNMVRSMCCRLQLRLDELLKRGNGLFGSSEQTGSLGVVTINCARLGYLYKGDEPRLLQHLDRLLELARDSLGIKRKIIQRHMDAGLFPYSKRYLGTLRNHFSTIGVNGINEMIRNFTEDFTDITSDSGHSMAARLLDHIRDQMVVFQEETGHMYNLEATPAEGCTYRFAREDQKRFPDILQAGTWDTPYYTNSSQLPVGYTDDPFLALEMQEELQAKYTGGTVLHLYMGERISSAEGCKRLVRRTLERFKIPYITISPTFSICPIHGYLSGEHEFCPVCDQALLRKQRQQEVCCAID